MGEQPQELLDEVNILTQERKAIERAGQGSLAGIAQPSCDFIDMEFDKKIFELNEAIRSGGAKANNLLGEVLDGCQACLRDQSRTGACVTGR